MDYVLGGIGTVAQCCGAAFSAGGRIARMWASLLTRPFRNVGANAASLRRCARKSQLRAGGGSRTAMTATQPIASNAAALASSNPA